MTVTLLDQAYPQVRRIARPSRDGVCLTIMLQDQAYLQARRMLHTSRHRV